MCQHGTSTTLLLPTPEHGPDENEEELARTGLRFKHRLWPVDSCIAQIVQALNASGVTTLGSCCGHDKGAGNIILADGRVLVITTREAAFTAELPHADPLTWDEQVNS
jgi:hypothetical protein